MVDDVLPEGYRFDVNTNAVAHAVLGKSTWAVLTALTLDIELFAQLHYRQSIEPDTELSELFKDVFLYHWKEESQHAILDELEWMRPKRRSVDAGTTRPSGRGVHRAGRRGGWHPAGAGRSRREILRAAKCGRAVDAVEARAMEAGLLKAYRWQYVHSGAQHPHFGKVLSSLITQSQGERIPGRARHAPLVHPRHQPSSKQGDLSCLPKPRPYSPKSSTASQH